MVKLIEAKLNELQIQFNAEIDKETDIRSEKLRLQGEHRALTQLLDDINKKKVGKNGRI